MRDVLNPNGIKLYLEDIEQNKGLIKNGAYNTSNEGIRILYVSLLLENTIGLYSTGCTKEEVKSSLIEAINAFADLFKFDNGYGDCDTMIWLLSLGLLCEIELTTFNKICEVLRRDKVKDALIEKIIIHKLGSWHTNTATVIQKHPYEKALSLNSTSDIKYYLDKVWYKGHSDAAWHEIHKVAKANSYFGYWAWETAAIVKIKGIDDSSLKDQLYYPYDAVHW
jgi:hypothetical protein